MSKFVCPDHGKFEPEKTYWGGAGWYDHLAYCPECNERIKDSDPPDHSIKVLSEREAVLKRPEMYKGTELYEKYKDEIEGMDS